MSRHSLDVEIDQFHFGEKEGAPKRPIELLDSETEFDRFSTVHHPRLIVARPNTSSKERESTDLKQRTGSKGLMASRNKGQTYKKAPKTQVASNLPLPPPLLPIELGLKAILDLRKKRLAEDLEEGEVAPQKGAKQQKKSKDPKDKRAKSVESRDKVKIR